MEIFIEFLCMDKSRQNGSRNDEQMEALKVAMKNCFFENVDTNFDQEEDIIY